MAQVAVILAGCGFLDGAETNEVMLTLLHLEKEGHSYDCFAPDIDQHHVVVHQQGEEASETRNVLTEASRLVRGNISPLSELQADKYAALLVPGGYGVAKNLSSLAFDGPNCTVNAEFESSVKAFAQQSKPVGLICIAPALAGKFYPAGVEVTIGNDAGTIEALEAMGAKHVECAVDGIHVDEKNKLVSTPAYMLAENIMQAEQGIQKLVKQVAALI